MKPNFADIWLFEMAPIELVDYTNTGIPGVQFVMVSGTVYPTSIKDMWKIIDSARELGLKGLRINKHDYTSRGLMWYIWFAGTPEDIIMFCLKYKNTITISQEKMNGLMDKISYLRSLYPEDVADIFLIITRVVTNQPIILQIEDETKSIDVSNLIDYTPNKI